MLKSEVDQLDLDLARLRSLDLTGLESHDLD